MVDAALINATVVLAIATILLMVATFFLWIVSWRSLDETRKATQGNLLLDLNRDFYLTDRLYKVRVAIESGEFDSRHFPEEDVDDYLGFFELMASLINRSIIETDLINETFGVYIVDAYKNKGIFNYIKRLRGEEEYKDPEIYLGFEELAKKLIETKK
jgi:Domain of unknown function (DUF4760)